MFTNNRDAYRQAFFIAWEKHLKHLPLNPIETELVKVILLHPEYHVLLKKLQNFQTQEFALEENPFVHMSLHLAVVEQIETNRPQGIREAYHLLLKKIGNEHDTLHFMMDCLAKIIWKAQQTGEIPDEKEYLINLSTKD